MLTVTWGGMEWSACTSICSSGDLKQWLTKIMANLLSRIIHEAVDQWQAGLSVYVQAKDHVGGDMVSASICQKSEGGPFIGV